MKKLILLLALLSLSASAFAETFFCPEAMVDEIPSKVVIDDNLVTFQHWGGMTIGPLVAKIMRAPESVTVDLSEEGQEGVLRFTHSEGSVYIYSYTEFGEEMSSKCYLESK